MRRGKHGNGEHQQGMQAERGEPRSEKTETFGRFGTRRYAEDMHERTTASRVLDRLLDPIGRCLSRRAARELAGLRADEEAQARVRELADKCNEGTLSAEESAEYEAYVMAANIVAILQAKARARLTTTP
jgi:hypothetical protein